ncbi:LysR family transcriptional regulator [Lichenihabitans sp. PAMC28606]|uniref:LysR family transcriptional regulator n=1 Tax=Lichenihabitans sp. PAMC28606 TaxID=2880932 RepID=UPI001D0B6D40|nr:LysR family transcriptional regulator [Lichenihabitans sp. PAMC28606]UDL94583.1 LysR family transcriptional regulator [Lichenihabitans sp. PAMC28606]
MSISLRQIAYVCAVADCGSIQAASRRLRISASSILAAIESAEFSLGARIFDRRRSSGIKTTPGGERFVAAGRSLLAAETDFQRKIGVLQSQTQSIRIGCFEPFGALFMTEGIVRFRDIVGRTDVALFEGDQTQLADWLDRGIVDIVISYDIGPKFNAHITPICRVPAHVMLPTGHPLAEAESLSIDDLATYPLVLLDLPLTVSYLLSLYDLHGIKPTVGFRSRSYETVRSAVSAGFGLAILNMRPITRSNMDNASVIRVPLSDPLPAPTLQIADLYGPMKPAHIKALVDVFVSLFRDSDPAHFAVVTPERRHLIFDV